MSGDIFEVNVYSSYLIPWSTLSLLTAAYSNRGKKSSQRFFSAKFHSRTWTVAERKTDPRLWEKASCDTMAFIQSCDFWVYKIFKAWMMKRKNPEEIMYWNSLCIDTLCINIHTILCFYNGCLIYVQQSSYFYHHIQSKEIQNRNRNMTLFICVRLFWGRILTLKHQFIMLFIFWYAMCPFYWANLFGAFSGVFSTV